MFALHKPRVVTHTYNSSTQEFGGLEDLKFKVIFPAHRRFKARLSDMKSCLNKREKKEKLRKGAVRVP